MSAKGSDTMPQGDPNIREINRMKKVVSLMCEALQECEDYFSDRMDADCDQDGSRKGGDCAMSRLLRLPTTELYFAVAVFAALGFLAARSF